MPEPTIASRSKASSSGGYADGLNDLYEPKSSRDTSKPYFTWWLKNGTEEWVQYDFPREEAISGVQVYWLVTDQYDCAARVPASWEVLYKSGDGWAGVESPGPYGTAENCYNEVHFKPVCDRRDPDPGQAPGRVFPAESSNGKSGNDRGPLR